ncbi:hypothetical protein RHGRI_013336 [Rhododendron griersonianum]|uniref:Thiamine pyrophosphate enzyme central domain-containing protein n=1 Tax=Rhododendron griersonianum TaxID=479676 RepID=A0AAV6K5L0_9ERIC|nr:hypothetical protein RHGRI_013336 [Rhododendron griersonianum]
MSEIEKAVSLLRHAERPLIVFGKGAAIARAENGLKKLVETTGIPFLPTPMGKGLLPDTHELAATTARSVAIGKCDVALVVGARLNWLLHFGELPKGSKDVQFILVDISKEEIELRKPCLDLVGDAAKDPLTMIVYNGSMKKLMRNVMIWMFGDVHQTPPMAIETPPMATETPPGQCATMGTETPPMAIETPSMATETPPGRSQESPYVINNFGKQLNYCISSFPLKDAKITFSPKSVYSCRSGGPEAAIAQTFPLGVGTEPLQSKGGCCMPPPYCGFEQNNLTWVIPQAGRYADDVNCVRWDSDKRKLCYDCETCQAVYIYTSEDNWTFHALEPCLGALVLIACFFFTFPDEWGNNRSGGRAANNRSV